ncbi:MAG: type IX secretion system membrane protein PorP/SprF [Bacteroidales bacterium]|nr:type IX secretion system membrane protein PorP/SprF [Bacteroidales bacterium]
MKKVLVNLMSFFILFVDGSGQYLLRFESYQTNPYFQGPSAIALSDSTTLTMCLEQPLNKFDARSPRTYSVLATTSSMNYYWGGMLTLDEWGKTTVVQSQISLAKSFKFNNKSFFSIGITAAARQFCFKASDHVYFDPLDPAISNLTERSFSFDFDAGTSFYVPHFSFTFTMMNLIRSKVRTGDEQSHGFYPEREIKIVNVAKFPINPHVLFHPSISYRQIGKKIKLFDTQFLFTYKSLYTAGLAIQFPLSLDLHAKLNYKRMQFSFIFSYFAGKFSYLYPLNMESTFTYFTPRNVINR